MALTPTQPDPIQVGIRQARIRAHIDRERGLRDLRPEPEPSVAARVMVRVILGHQLSPDEDEAFRTAYAIAYREFMEVKSDG